MGTPLPENPEGAACGFCWGVGKPFGTGGTPTIITLRLFDLEEGEFWDDVIGARLKLPIALYQSNPACLYESVDDDLDFRLQFHFDETELIVAKLPEFRLVFHNVDNDPCELSGPNDLIQPDDNFSYNGRYLLEWSEVWT